MVPVGTSYTRELVRVIRLSDLPLWSRSHNERLAGLIFVLARRHSRVGCDASIMQERPARLCRRSARPSTSLLNIGQRFGVAGFAACQTGFVSVVSVKMVVNSRSSSLIRSAVSDAGSRIAALSTLSTVIVRTRALA